MDWREFDHENVIFLAGRTGRGTLLQWRDAAAWAQTGAGANFLTTAPHAPVTPVAGRRSRFDL
jgi:hypothetical protein